MLTPNQRVEFGRYLKSLRDATRKSLRQVQREVGISPAYLALIEGGERNPPQPSFLNKLALCYGVKPVELLRRAGHLPDEEPPDVGLHQLRRAYRFAVSDPKYQIGTSLDSEPTPEVMRLVVRMYEELSGLRLLGRDRPAADSAREEG